MGWALSSPYARHPDSTALLRDLLPRNSSDYSCLPAQIRSMISPYGQFPPMELVVSKSWGDEPYHLVIALGRITLDEDSLSDCDVQLANREGYFRGGTYLGLLVSTGYCLI